MDLGPVAAREPQLRREGGREAAVLLPVYRGADGPNLLFIERAPDLSEHPGEMSFPGGGAEPVDADRRETALREADEEIGLAAESVEVVGRLDDVQTITGYVVSPFVARVPPRQYEPSNGEVQAVVPLPIEALADPANHAFRPRPHPAHGTIPVHHFTVDEYTIWGATARMLVQLLSLITDWEAPEPPDSPLWSRP
ncbi:MAG: NUDIX hydrolase [Halodesulfurarchaeum sp.]